METSLKVGDLMTRNFTHVPPQTTLKDCAKIMIKNKVGSLLVTENQKLKGILTEKDIVWAASKSDCKDFSEIQIKDIMTKKVTTIKPGTDITKALKKFKTKKVRRLPVIEKRKLIGLITTTDILKIDPELFLAIHETLKIKEEKSKIRRHNIQAKRKTGICEECGELEILYKDDNQWLCSDCYTKR
jgi:CBS domain-containing protein